MEIYISKGVIKDLKELRDYYSETLTSSQSMNILNRNSEEANIVIVVDVIETATNIVQLVISDTEDSMSIDLEEEANERFKSSKLIKGNVLILNNIFFKGINKQISVHSFYRIGHKTLESKEVAIQTSDETTEVIQTNKRKLDDSQESCDSVCDKKPKLSSDELGITIDQLKPSKEKFSLQVKVTNKTQLKNFQKNNRDCTYVRFQLEDTSGCIEAVAFGNEATHWNNALKVNKMYSLENATIKLRSNSGYKAWPNTTSDYDLTITKNTMIKEIIENSPKKDKSLPVDENNNNMASANPVVQIQSFDPTKPEYKLVDVVKIKDLANVPFNRYDKFQSVNVLGIIESIDELREITKKNGEPLALRNFFLIEQSGYFVKVALWGDEATSFNYKKGDILFIENAKISSYGGLSLNIFMETIIEKMDTSINCREILELWKWWNEEWWISRNRDKRFSVNHLLQKKKEANNL